MNIPSALGRYEIQRVLGQGAMGIVYLARDPVLQRLVAIKAVRKQADDPQIARERFKREAEVSALLNHPNIITVFDQGEDPDYGPYLAMEYVDGPSLTQKIQEGLPIEVGLHLLVQGMGALGAAHDAGITHRDVKPENILVGAGNRFKLMDFGIAWREGSKLTQSGALFGTPAYTAPELLLDGKASPAIDRYAFAVTAFEIITGTVPYHGTSIGMTLYKIAHEEPTFPKGLSPGLEAVFRRAFKKNPKERFPSLEAFLKALIRESPIPEEARGRLLAQFEADTSPGGTQIFPQTLVSRKQETEAADGTRPISGKARVRDEESPSADVNKVTPLDTRPLMGLEQDAMRATTEEHPAEQETLINDQRRRPASWFLALATCLGAGAILAVGYARTRQPSGLKILSNPSGAEVLMDGRSLGFTPAQLLPRPQGSHILQFRMAGFLTFSRPISEDQDAVSVTLQPRPEKIPVVTDPPGARVFLNGHFAGISPITALTLPTSGNLELRVTLDGFQDWEADIDRDIDFPELIRLSPEKQVRKKKPPRG